MLDNLHLTGEAELQVSIGEARLHRLPRRPHTHCRREVFTDDNLAVAVKVEHSTTDSEPYQCWNEFIIWDEHVKPHPEIAQYIAPTLEMGVYKCPVHDACVCSVSIQEYIDDGYPRMTQHTQPWMGCVGDALRSLREIGLDIYSDVLGRESQQVVYSLERKSYVIVDYGLVANAPGVRLQSRRRPDGFWAWVRKVLPWMG